jgi:long-subunit fatty acid transport protein
MKDLSDGKQLNGVFAEAAYKPAAGWTAFSRAEWEQNSEVDAGGIVRSVGELTFGGIRDWMVADHTKFGLGASYTFDFVPSATALSYGSDPHGAMVFARVTLD